MEPYDPNKPWISVNLPSREELIAMAMGLIPGGRALKNMHDNPEGPISETLDLAAEDLVPLYASLIKPAIKGEDIDWNSAGKEAAMNAFALPVFLRNSKKGYVVKPQTAAELEKFNKAIDAGVAKGEISAADGRRFKENAVAAIAEDAAYDRHSNYRAHTEPETIIPRSDILPRDLPVYDAASAAGTRIGNNIEAPAKFRTRNGNEFSLKGDQGKLLWNEHYLDDNNVRHKSNYQELSDNELMLLARRFPGYQPGKIMPITVDGRITQVYDVAAKPQITNAIGKKLGYNYGPAVNKPLSEGRAATLRDPKYRSVDDFYRIMLGLEE